MSSLPATGAFPIAQVPVPAAKSTAASDVLPNLASFTRHLRAENKSPATITTYGKAVLQLADFLAAAGTPTLVASIRREHVEAFLIDLQDHHLTATFAASLAPILGDRLPAVGPDAP